MTNEEAIELITCVRREGTFSVAEFEAVKLAIQALEKQVADSWIPVSERLPEKSGIYLATFTEGDNRYVERFYYSTFSGWMMPVEWQDEGRIDEIIAWKSLPDPWRGDDSEI